jgi:guanylate kinase
MGPSGSGKSTIQHWLPKEIKFLTHYVTRKPREDEIDGYHVKYVPAGEYLALSQAGRIATSTEYAGNFYGSPMAAIEEIKNGSPYHATATIDSIGQFRFLIGDSNVVAIYIKPPSVEVLRERMKARGDTEESIDRRIAHIYSAAELENEKFADYIVVNDDLEAAKKETLGIIYDELYGRGRLL